MTITNDYVARLMSEQRSAELRHEAAVYRLVRTIKAAVRPTRATRSGGGPGRPVQIPRQRERPRAERGADQPLPGSSARTVDHVHGHAA
jgi:hypothetical protein